MRSWSPRLCYRRKKGQKRNHFQGEGWEAQERVFMTRSQRYLFLPSASVFITPSRLKLRRQDTYKRGKPDSLLPAPAITGSVPWHAVPLQGAQLTDSDCIPARCVSAGWQHACTPAAAATARLQRCPERRASPRAKRAQGRRRLDNTSLVQHWKVPDAKRLAARLAERTGETRLPAMLPS